MALIPRPQLQLTARDPWQARTLRRVVGSLSLGSGVAAAVIGLRSLVGPLSNGADWILIGLGLLLTAFGVTRLRPRPLAAETPLQPARTHLLYGICASALAAATPLLGMSWWAAVMFGAFGLVEFVTAFTIYRLSGFRLSGDREE